MATLETLTDAAERAGDVNIEIIARAIHDGFNTRRLDEAAQWVSDGCEWLDVPSGAAFHGPSGFVAFAHGWIEAFPDCSIEVRNVIASGDVVASELIGVGTHEGPLIRPSEIIAPTGRRVVLRCVDVQQYGGGQIVRARFYYDAMSLLRQLGKA